MTIPMLRTLVTVLFSGALLSGTVAAGAGASPCSPPKRALLGTAAGDSPGLGSNVVVGCPLAEPAGHPTLSLKVVYWCAVPTPFNNQVEFKFKIRIIDAGRTPLDLSLTHWRLLLTSFAVRRWVPPHIGQPTERPSIISYRGHRIWAVTANANRAYDLDSATGYAGFATHWDVPSYLGPGQAFFRPAVDQGDLAYYVPATSVTHDAYGNPVLHGFIGLAYVNDGRVIALAPVPQWGKRLPAENF